VHRLGIAGKGDSHFGQVAAGRLQSSQMLHEPRHGPVAAEIPRCGVVVFESHHAGDFRMGLSRHTWMEVFYVLQGRGTFDLDGRAVPCSAGDVVVVPVGCAHRITDDQARPLAMYGLRIRPDVWVNVRETESLLPAGRIHRNRLASLGVRAEFRQMLFEQSLGRPGSNAMLVALALRLMALLARTHARPEHARTAQVAGSSSLRHKVEAYVADLEHRFLQSTDIDHAAAALGMSRRRFTELFRQVTGATWSRYLRQLRIGHARELLGSTSKTVLSVAFESGFEDLSSFYRAFRAELGISPDRWRKQRQ
jgi:AraC-like DNA-binding protein